MATPQEREQLKNELLRKLAGQFSGPYREVYQDDHRVGDYQIEKLAGGHYHLTWSLVDNRGKLLDEFDDSFESFNDMWDILEELLELKPLG